MLINASHDEEDDHDDNFFFFFEKKLTNYVAKWNEILTCLCGISKYHSFIWEYFISRPSAVKYAIVCENIVVKKKLP